MSENRSRDPFSGLRTPRVPAGLKGRVLAAAARTRPVNDAPTFWDRIWERRPLRLAWAVTTGALLLAHAALSLAPGPGAARPAGGDARGQREELRDALALPTIEISPSAERFSMGASLRDDPPRTHEDPEVKA